MALAKTDGTLQNVSGKCGGDVWQRNASGLHITAQPTLPKKYSTTDQKKQRDWYAGKKTAERNGGVTPPDVTEDPKPKECVVYGLRTFAFAGCSGNPPPVQQPTTTDADILLGYRIWVEGHWDLLRVIPGLTVDAAVTIICKLVWTARTTLGASQAAAETVAFQRMLAAAGYCSEYPPWGFVAAGAIILLGATYYIYTHPTGPMRKTNNFAWDCMIIHTEHNWMFGVMTQRPSRDMIDIRPLQIIPIPPVYAVGTGRSQVTPAYRMGWLWLYQEEYIGLLWVRLAAWDNLTCQYIGNGYLTTDGYYRCQADSWYLIDHHVPNPYYTPGNYGRDWLPELYA